MSADKDFFDISKHDKIGFTLCTFLDGFTGFLVTVDIDPLFHISPLPKHIQWDKPTI